MPKPQDWLLCAQLARFATGQPLQAAYPAARARLLGGSRQRTGRGHAVHVLHPGRLHRRLRHRGRLCLRRGCGGRQVGRPVGHRSRLPRLSHHGSGGSLPLRGRRSSRLRQLLMPRRRRRGLLLLLPRWRSRLRRRLLPGRSGRLRRGRRRLAPGRHGHMRRRWRRRSGAALSALRLLIRQFRVLRLDSLLAQVDAYHIAARAFLAVTLQGARRGSGRRSGARSKTQRQGGRAQGCPQQAPSTGKMGGRPGLPACMLPALSPFSACEEQQHAGSLLQVKKHQNAAGSSAALSPCASRQ